MGKNEDFGVVVCNGRFRVFKNGEILKIKGGVESKAKISYSSNYPTVFNGGTFFVHKLIAEAFLPNPDHKSQINHIDGDKNNYSVENLEWVTPSENMVHAYKTGLTHGRAGIKNEKYKESKSFLLKNTYLICVKNGISISKLEKILGLGNGSISRWGKVSPNVLAVKKIADYFGVTVDDLLSDGNNTDSDQ